MTEPGRTRDEEILSLLCAGPASTAALAERLGWYERSVRRRLRRLIKDGYVFSPERGRYRITAAGLGAMMPAELPLPAPNRLGREE
jgi:predicted ArsR family transcriptional regulator